MMASRLSVATMTERSQDPVLLESLLASDIGDIFRSDNFQSKNDRAMRIGLFERYLCGLATCQRRDGFAN